MPKTGIVSGVGRKVASVLLMAGLSLVASDSAQAVERAKLAAEARGIFGELPSEARSTANPVSAAKIELGRKLYFETRLSKNHDVACNSCHRLDRFGVDGEPTSPGHRGQRGGRNSPTVLNAALHVAQFWDGRAPDVEAQAKGPILNPVEMAMPSEAVTVAVLRSIPGYRQLFEAAFPGQGEPISYDNMARAIGAFERRLLTPGPLDRFMEDHTEGLSDVAVEGLQIFIRLGCVSCHAGPAIGGGLYQKLGLVRPYPTQDPGRQGVTGKEVDRGFFKVPSLRNIAETGPYFHDGQVETLEQAVRLMASHQLGIDLSTAQVGRLLAFLRSLTGEIDAAYVAEPELPASGPDTPTPDPS